MNYENNQNFWGVFSFAGGPTQLPRAVLHKIEKEFYNFNSKSIIEIQKYDHQYHEILTKAIDNLTQLLTIPQEFKIIFSNGGASLLFEAIPMNLIDKTNNIPIYTNTGYWSKKALDEAYNLCDQITIGTTIKKNEQGQLYVPNVKDWQLNNKNYSYLHYCDNETVEGLEYPFIPKIDQIPLITDMSSNFLTKQINWNKYDLIYAHAQKNIGIAGSALMIIRPELVKQNNVPYMWDFKEMISKQSMINTLPIFPIYVNTLMFDWMKEQGDIKFWEEYCERRCKKIYELIDRSHGIFINNIQKDQRSRINITFNLINEQQTQNFISKCKENGIIEIKGHRAIGGIRICLYLPISQLAIDKLINVMEEFMLQ